MYWVGPIIGALLAALFYNTLTLADRLDRERHQDYPLSTPGGTGEKRVFSISCYSVETTNTFDKRHANIHTIIIIIIVAPSSDHGVP